MKRLTEKDKECIGGYTSNGVYDISWQANAFEKLGKLEDIEEEYGVDLIILFQAKGIFVEEQNTDEKEIVFEEVTLDLDNKLLLFKHPRKEIGKGRNISQYGKTWALTREELELS